MARKKSGSFAIPFLVTLLISLVLFGGAGLYVYDRMTVSKSDLEPMESEIKMVSEEDTHSILFVLDVSLTREDAEPVFLLYYTKPVAHKVIFVGIPNNMILETSSGERSVQSLYQTNGIQSLQDSLDDAFEIKIDHYMRLDSSSFQKLCNIMGGVTYYVPIATRGLSMAKSPQELSAEQIEIMLTSSKYESTTQRAYVACSCMADMFSQCNGDRIADSLDINYEAISELLINATDITSEDYKERKHAIKFILTNTNVFPSYFTPTGSETAEGFVPDDRFIETLHERME